MNHRMASPPYGASLCMKSCIPATATLSHAATRFLPKSGIAPSQAGGGGTSKVDSDFTQLVMRSALDTIVSIDSQRGTTRKQRRTTVITATASDRRPQSRPWMEIINGQVAVTIVTDQIAAPRNGLSIQSDVPSRAPMKSTANKVRVMSRWVSAMESPFRLAFASSNDEKVKQSRRRGFKVSLSQEPPAAAIRASIAAAGRSYRSVIKHVNQTIQPAFLSR